LHYIREVEKKLSNTLSLSSSLKVEGKITYPWQEKKRQKSLKKTNLISHNSEGIWIPSKN